MSELWTAFLLGLIGSLHCAGMCGPLALALPVTSGSALSFAAGRAAYNLGRVLTYCGLGVIFGLMGKTLLLAGIQRWVSISLGVLLLAGLFGSRKLALSRPVSVLVAWLKTRMSARLRQRSFSSLLLLGILNGLLPCGLVYVAGAGAVLSDSVLSGAAYMAAFGAGTLPMMLAISGSGKLIPLSLRLKLLKALPISVFLLATLLILRGMSLGIPYLSPNLATGACCHP
ncbi:MAG TPA: sulfite exporter TauE/SafE family protein [Verrucomicrobiae bacterium]|jgi:sulfite exporter TauE/SafE|nr:sulfite exporter TauE/SafE family protein [Verrucomicrobiae bacterium]